MLRESLSERLREFTVVVYNPDGSQGRIHPVICTQAADDRDAKDKEIAALKDECEIWWLSMEATDIEAKDAEIERLRTVRDAALAINEECRDGMSPSLGSLAKLSDALHAEWK